MDFIKNLNVEAKVAVGLVISEKMFSLIGMDEPGYNIGRDALDNCWKWLEGEDIEADELCNYIDSEDYLDVAEFANKEKDRQKQYTWYSLLDAVSYTTYQAYKKEKRNSVPQVVEIIDDETLIILGENAIESGVLDYEWLSPLKGFLLENYSIGAIIESTNSLTKDRLDKVILGTLD